MRRPNRPLRALLVAIALLLSGCNAPKTILHEGKPYTPAQYASALDAAESRFFTVGFRLCDVLDACTSAGSRPVHYDLVLQNTTGQILRDVRITVGLSQKMCDAFASPIWYNERADIVAGGTALYSWEPQLILSRASGPVQEELRDMLVEIHWRGGSELLRLQASESSMPAQFAHLLEDLPPFPEISPGVPPEEYATDS